jgi:D-alanine-D-alanine ligase
VLYNEKRPVPEGAPADQNAEYDDIVVPMAIKSSIEKLGFKAELVEADENAYVKLQRGRFDFVFNIAEGLHGESRESHFPAILEMLKIPYTGSGILTHALTLDKKRTKDFLEKQGLPTAKSQVFSSGDELLDESLRFPLVVKPNSEGSSKGITERSLVNDEPALRKVAKELISDYGHSAIAEAYLPGREFTVALLGNKGEVYRMPIIEIFVDRYGSDASIATYENKFVKDTDSHSGVAEIDSGLRKKIHDYAVECFEALDCRDFCRVDFKCDKHGMPNVLELNSLPGVHPKFEHVSYFPKACRLAGLDYDEMIACILYFGLKRHKKESVLKGRAAFLKKLKKIDSGYE